MKNVLIRAVLILLLCVTTWLPAKGTEKQNHAGLRFIRLRSQASIYIGRSFVTIHELINADPIKLPHNNDQNVINVAQLRLWPMLVDQGGVTSLACRVLQPEISIFGGELLRCRYVNKDGVTASTSEAMAPGGFYVIEISFGKGIPDEFVITVQMIAAFNGSDNLTRLIYRASNDGYTGILKYPKESRYLLEIGNDPALGMLGVEGLPGEISQSRTSPELDPEKPYVIAHLKLGTDSGR